MDSSRVRSLEKKIVYDAMDEKLITLSEKGIIIMSGEIANGAASLFFITASFMQITRPGQPIWVMMNSPGGSANESFAIYDIMKAFVRRGMVINIFGVGQIASAAVALLQVGVRRCSFPHTQFLVHQIRGGTDDQEEEVSQGEERIEEQKRINKIYMTLVSNRTGMPVEEIIKLAKKTDYWLDAEAAKSFGPNGLIDEIVEDYPFEF